MRREAAHHAFDKAARISLSGDLARLERWLQQIAARDYLQVGDRSTVAATLAECRAALEEQGAATAGEAR
jgi:hypothetical protein